MMSTLCFVNELPCIRTSMRLAAAKEEMRTLKFNEKKSFSRL